MITCNNSLILNEDKGAQAQAMSLMEQYAAPLRSTKNHVGFTRVKFSFSENRRNLSARVGTYSKIATT